jgi:hypothetical protein
MSDVDNYLKKLRQALEEKINDNYKITLECNTTQLKRFAQEARRKLLEQVAAKT